MWSYHALIFCSQGRKLYPLLWAGQVHLEYYICFNTSINKSYWELECIHRKVKRLWSSVTWWTIKKKKLWEYPNWRGAVTISNFQKHCHMKNGLDLWWVAPEVRAKTNKGKCRRTSFQHTEELSWPHMNN